MNTNDNDKDLINELLDILEKLDWSIASQIDQETGDIQGFICGNEQFLESVLEAVSLQTGDDIDFSQVRGNKDELN